MTGGMMFKGTPGPWKYGVRKDKSIWISLGDPVKGPHHQGDFFGTENDARLTVAAPDLLEALMKILSEYDSWKGYNDDGLEEKTELYARAAIAKALGEQK